MTRTYAITLTYDGRGFHVTTNGHDNGSFYTRREVHLFLRDALDELDGTAEANAERAPEDVCALPDMED